MKNFLIINWLITGLLIFASLSFAAESDVDKLLDLLVEKGVVTKDYAAGVFNGHGINKIDANERKDFIGRLVFHPFKEWSLGGSYYNGYGSWGTPVKKNDRDRVGAEFAYVKDPLSLRGEYIRGNDGSTNKEGWYLQGGYFLIPKKFQAVAKFDAYDKNIDVDENEVNVYTLGANWYFNKWAFFQLNYELKDETSIKEVDNNALTGQLTLQF